jgi:uncharacterized protein YjbI with pentapeptide repeats
MPEEEKHQSRLEPGHSRQIVTLWDALRGAGACAGPAAHRCRTWLMALPAWLSKIGVKGFSALKDVWARAKPGEVPPVAHDAPTPADLLKAVNDAASTGNTSWVFFLAQMAYFYITVASVTHRDLLLNAPVQLPLLQTQISLEFFFQWGPFVFVLLHFGLLLQHEMLARKLRGLNDVLAPTEGNAPGSNPLRLELSSYFFAQSMAGPTRSTLLKVLMRTMTFLTFGLLPLGLLLFFQITFLPYHSEEVSWWQRGALILDLAVLTTLGVFLTFPDRSYFEAFLCHIRRRPAAFAGSALIGLSALALSFLVAVVPDGKLEKDLLAGPLCWKVEVKNPSEKTPKRWACFLTALLFETPTEDPTKNRPFKRSLVVMDQDLVPDKEWEPKEPSLLLAKRNLSYARFDRSDLHRADLREANLYGASLDGTNLRDARMSCVTRKTQVPCTILTGASLQETQLEEADLFRAGLQGADLSRANLRGADLSEAQLQGASLGKDLLGADLSRALLQGADLSGAGLQGADLSGARLQGARLVYARLQGADLSGAHLEGAYLSGANLHGANLWGARLQAADLTSAKIWQTRSPKSDTEWADMRDVKLNAPSSEDLQALQTLVDGIADVKMQQRIKQKFAPLLDDDVKAKEWDNSVHKAWHEIVRVSLIDDDKKRAGLSDYLAALACADGSNGGWVARGILIRATSVHMTGVRDALPDIKGDTDVQNLEERMWLEEPGRGRMWSVEAKQIEMTDSFNGDPARLHARLTGPDCRVAAKVKEHVPHLLESLSLKRAKKEQAEKEKANQEP